MHILCKLVSLGFPALSIEGFSNERGMLGLVEGMSIPVNTPAFGFSVRETEGVVPN